MVMPNAAGSRLLGLDAAATQRVMAVAQALDGGRAGEAGDLLVPLLQRHPGHAEVLRLHAGILSLFGAHDDAIAAMHQALARRPEDPLYHNTLGSILATAGRYDEAAEAFAQAARLKPDLAGAWYNLGVLLVRSMRNDEAAEALRKAVALEPGNFGARIQLADLLRAENHADAANAEYRAVLAQAPFAGMAWWGLADLRTHRFSESEVRELEAAANDPRASSRDAIATGFALARALDQHGRYAESLAAIERANVIARRHTQWDARGFSASVAAIESAFATVPASDGNLGKGIVFVASLPRSGSTLIEQILASHPQVEGAGELPDLPLVINEESRRRGAPLQQWAVGCGKDDWQRLGTRYIERTARWRQRRPVFVDKLPSNWYYVGAIRAMLPAARIILARRDPLETCFSCYRQMLENNEYTRTYPDLAAHWRDFDRIARGALAQHPTHVHECVHERLLADTETEIRRLLAACDLPFDPACLDFHRTERQVRSPSAMQVREPLQQDTRHSLRYGALLDPLRAELGLPPFAAT